MAERKRVLNLTDRAALEITAVKEVLSFDDEGATLVTDDGELCVEGEQIRISNLNTDSGTVLINGKINAISYTDDRPQKSRGLFGRRLG